MRQLLPRHDGSKPSSIRPNARGDSRDDLIIGPAAKAGFLVWRQIAPDDGPDAGNRESDIGTCQRAGKVRLAQEIARRMAVVAAGDGGEILATLDLRVCRRGSGGAKNRGRGNSLTVDLRGQNAPDVAMSPIDRIGEVQSRPG
jgi:hypothetical protein